MKLGFPEFPSLSVSWLRLSSIGICLTFGTQKLSNVCSSAPQLQPGGQPLGPEQLCLLQVHLQKLCRRHSAHGSVAKGTCFSGRSPAFSKVRAQRQWDTDKGSSLFSGFQLIPWVPVYPAPPTSCSFSFVALTLLSSGPIPDKKQHRQFTQSPQIQSINPYTKSLLQHYSHWFWFINHAPTGR